jgi:hypothetical protein
MPSRRGALARTSSRATTGKPGAGPDAERYRFAALHPALEELRQRGTAARLPTLLRLVLMSPAHATSRLRR